MADSESRILLRTYGKMWKFERKIYAIDRIRLIVPVNPDEAIYFVGTCILMYAVSFTSTLPFILRFILIPFGVTKLLTKVKLDGKLPHKFVAAYLEFLCLPKKICRFQPVEEYKAGRFGRIVCRDHVIVDVTDEIAKKWRQNK